MRRNQALAVAALAWALGVVLAYAWTHRGMYASALGALLGPQP